MRQTVRSETPPLAPAECWLRHTCPAPPRRFPVKSVSRVNRVKLMSTSIQRIAILGTGLIGTSIGLALRRCGYSGSITGWDRRPEEAAVALAAGALDAVASDGLAAAEDADLILLATPVFAILEWMQKLAPLSRPGQLITDVGSTKRLISEQAVQLFGVPGRATFLPGHPMAGKEVFGAVAAEAGLFEQAVWLFCRSSSGAAGNAHPLEREWRHWVGRFGCRQVDIDPERHDDLCAWASHLPQMVGTALAALLEDTFGASEPLREELRGIGGRAMREMTRLGASPFSMWRDIAHTNTDRIASTLLALEQRLAYVRLHLTGPGLREEFERANRFRRHF